MILIGVQELPSLGKDFFYFMFYWAGSGLGLGTYDWWMCLCCHFKKICQALASLGQGSLGVFVVVQERPLSSSGLEKAWKPHMLRLEVSKNTVQCMLPWSRLNLILD